MYDYRYNYITNTVEPRITAISEKANTPYRPYFGPKGGCNSEVPL